MFFEIKCREKVPNTALKGGEKVRDYRKRAQAATPPRTANNPLALSCPAALFEEVAVAVAAVTLTGTVTGVGVTVPVEAMMVGMVITTLPEVVTMPEVMFTTEATGETDEAETVGTIWPGP